MAKTKRNQEIIMLRQKGESLRTIANKYGISKDRVSEICRKADIGKSIKGAEINVCH